VVVCFDCLDFQIILWKLIEPVLGGRDDLLELQIALEMAGIFEQEKRLFYFVLLFVVFELRDILILFIILQCFTKWLYIIFFKYLITYRVSYF